MKHQWSFAADVCEKCHLSALVLHRIGMNNCLGMKIIIGTPWKEREKNRTYNEGVTRAMRTLSEKIERAVFATDFGTVSVGV